MRCFTVIAMPAALALALAGCTSSRESSPRRTATEQLLISKAADEAAARLTLPLPKGARVFVDAGNFEGTDGKYAIGAIRDRLLELGARLAPERSAADIVVEIRAGALSVDEHKTLFGIPESEVPVPLTGDFTFPEIALFKRDERLGIAKFAATAYDAKEGRLIGTTEPRFGFSYRRKWVVLLFVSWTTDNLIPKSADEGPPEGLEMLY
jgi:hypothetical protein